MLELNVEECLEYLKNFQDPKAECERKISEMARASIKDKTETGRNWSHERMKQYVEAYYILKKNEN
jgi:hypothetical protein